MPNQQRDAIHPGEVLREVYMKPSWPPLTVAALSKATRIPQRHMRDVIKGKRDITSVMAARLSSMCRTTKDYWLSLQRTYDVKTGKRKVLPSRLTKSRGKSAA